MLAWPPCPARCALAEPCTMLAHARTHSLLFCFAPLHSLFNRSCTNPCSLGGGVTCVVCRQPARVCTCEHPARLVFSYHSIPTMPPASFGSGVRARSTLRGASQTPKAPSPQRFGPRAQNDQPNPMHPYIALGLPNTRLGPELLARAAVPPFPLPIFPTASPPTRTTTHRPTAGRRAPRVARPLCVVGGAVVLVTGWAGCAEGAHVAPRAAGRRHALFVVGVCVEAQRPLPWAPGVVWWLVAVRAARVGAWRCSVSFLRCVWLVGQGGRHWGCFGGLGGPMGGSSC